MKKIDKKIFNKEIIEKNKFLITILCLIFFMTITYLFSIPKSEIDYKKANKDTFIQMSYETYDRDVYNIAEQVITEFVNSYQTIKKLDTSKLIEYMYTGYSVDDYYDALTKDYQRFLGTRKYMNLAKDFLSRFATKTENGIEINTNHLIKKMYKIKDKNDYFFELNTALEGTTAYIGIRVNDKRNRFYIYYLE